MLFESLFGQLDQLLRPSMRSAFESRAERLSQDEEAFTLQLAMPGVEAEDVHLEVHDGYLQLTAEAEAKDPEGFVAVRRERGPRETKRSWKLPERVDTEAIEAKLSEGVLALTIPKIPTQAAKRIEIAA